MPVIKQKIGGFSGLLSRDICFDKVVKGEFYALECPKCGWIREGLDSTRYCPECGEDLLTMSLHKKDGDKVEDKTEGEEMKYEVLEKDDDYMTSDKIADLLVSLYAEYRRYSDILGFSCNKDYSKAVGVAIRMLSD